MARVVPRAPQRRPTRCIRRHAGRDLPACIVRGVLRPYTWGLRRLLAATATAARESSRRRMQQKRGWKLKLTLNRTRASGREASSGNDARPPKHKKEGTCPEKHRGVRLKSQTDTSWAPNRQEWSSPRPWRPPGSPPSPVASRRARSSPPPACGPSCSTSVAQSHKTRLRSRPLKTPRGHRAAPGLPSGPAPGPREALPRIWGAGAAPPHFSACPISGGFSGKWRKPGTRPR